MANLLTNELTFSQLISLLSSVQHRMAAHPPQAADLPGPTDLLPLRGLRVPQLPRGGAALLAAGGGGQLSLQQLLPQLHPRSRRPARHRLLPVQGEGQGKHATHRKVRLLH